MRAVVTVKDLKCEECKDKVLKSLSTLDGISNVLVDIKNSTLSLKFNSHNAMEGVRLALKEIGFPITGDPTIIIQSKKNDYINTTVNKVTSN
jgi:copper chaperone CopZ